MKILNLYLKNINSLEGESWVYFDQAPIADGGVFAITGPNGSGKTSILDAITLALYGETYRFDRPAEHVITKQTADSAAQVEFQLAGERFRARWQVKRNDTGELNPAEMRLTKVDAENTLLAQTATQVRQQIAELTGMDFHKFTKSMVLSQGDFAAFLNALDSERLDILEKISGTDLYTEYKTRVEKRHTELQTRLKQLQQDIALIPVQDAPTLEAYQHDLDDFKQQVEEFKTQQQGLTQQLNWVKDCGLLENQVAGLQAAEEKLSAQIATREQQLADIAAAQPALAFDEDLQALDAKTEQLRQSQATLNAYRREAVALQQQLAAAGINGTPPPAEATIEAQKNKVDDLKLQLGELRQTLPREMQFVEATQMQLNERQISLAEIDSWLVENAGDAVLIDDFPETAKLKALRQEMQRLEAQQKTHTKWTKNTQGTLKKNQGALKALETAIVDGKKRIESDEKALKELLQGHSLEELAELKIEQEERMQDFRELYDLAEVYGKLNKKGFFSFFSRRKAHDEMDAERLVNRAETLKMELVKEENILKALQQAVAQDVLIKRLDAERPKLEDGKPCPLCGALEHPYAKKPPVVVPRADRKQALSDQRNKLALIKSALDNVSRQIKATQQQSVQRSERDEKLMQMRIQWQTLGNRLNAFSGDMRIDNLALHKKRLDEESGEFSRISVLLKKCNQLQKGLDDLRLDIEAKQGQVVSLRATVEQAELDWQNRPQEQIDWEKAFEAAKAEEKVLIPKVEQQLARVGEKMPKAGKEDALFDKLNQRRQDYQTRQIRQKMLGEEIAKLQEHLQASQQNIVSINARLAELSGLLQAAELGSFHLALVEKQKLIAGHEPQLAQLEAELKAMQQALAAKLSAQPFKTVEALRATLQTLTQEPKIQQQLAEDQQRLTELQQQHGQRLAQWQAEVARALTAVDEAALTQQLQQTAEKLDIAKQEVLTLESKLQKQKGYQENHARLQAQLDGVMKEVEVAAEDLQLTLPENNIAFRRKVQQLMIERLLSHTNKTLENLSGRYYLRHQTHEQGLALEIEDTLQNNTRRLPKTLSGGESFIVSLALALALAEIANNGQAVDSLFLDEGFGNLDADALYLAMTTLESLKAQGKIVGIISHVDAVKKRIKTQIELVKKPNGLSMLKVV